MIILDTNVISELARRAPDQQVLAWVDAQDDVAVTATTLAELLYGVARLPEGARRSQLTEGIRAIIDDELGGQVIAFDRTAAAHYADIVAARSRQGRPMGIADGQIAATCRARGATLATRNVRDFEEVGILVVDPWSSRIGSEGQPPPAGL
jgi:predicted nucleic acid-binding protein